ncbi:MAG TPA: hypothetical protein VKQ29_01705 [Aliidongia sp.]|nr:hypothetical protein [Aliidongia sp.]
MVELTTADLIWNRACLDDVTTPLVGDKALASLLHFHNLAMNGGPLHAVECLAPYEIEDAASGYRFFGFSEVADLLGGVTVIGKSADEMERLEAELDRRYGKLIPWDNVLTERFRAYLQDHPSDFAPL